MKNLRQSTLELKLCAFNKTNISGFNKRPPLGIQRPAIGPVPISVVVIIDRAMVAAKAELDAPGLTT